MGIHNLGYRHWQGDRTSSAFHWLVVAENGIRRAWGSSWLRRMLFFAWLPSISMGFLIFLYEQSESGSPASRATLLQLSPLLMDSDTDIRNARSGVLDLLTKSRESPGEARHMFWSSLLLTLFRRSQPFILIPMIGIIAPPLISQDIRSRAFLIYFSRPLSRTQYVVGKLATVLFYVFLITLLPALLLFCTGVLLSPDLSVLSSTLDLPLRIFAASAVIALPTASLALMLSSLTVESRFAAFAWFSLWIFGAFTASLITNAQWGAPDSGLRYLSLFELFSDVTATILDPDLGDREIVEQFSVLTVITGVSMAVLIRRISAPLQA